MATTTAQEQRGQHPLPVLLLLLSISAAATGESSSEASPRWQSLVDKLNPDRDLSKHGSLPHDGSTIRPARKWRSGLVTLRRLLSAHGGHVGTGHSGTNRGVGGWLPMATEQRVLLASHQGKSSGDSNQDLDAGNCPMGVMASGLGLAHLDSWHMHRHSQGGSDRIDSSKQGEEEEVEDMKPHLKSSTTECQNFCSSQGKEYYSARPAREWSFGKLKQVRSVWQGQLWCTCFEAKDCHQVTPTKDPVSVVGRTSPLGCAFGKVYKCPICPRVEGYSITQNLFSHFHVGSYPASSARDAAKTCKTICLEKKTPYFSSKFEFHALEESLGYCACFGAGQCGDVVLEHGSVVGWTSYGVGVQ